MESLQIQEQEIAAVEEVIRHESETGQADDHTKHVRVRRGIYSQRGKPGRYVIRVRVPAGILSSDQWEAIADVVEKDAASGYAHLTTRQGIEIADVAGDRVGSILRQLADAGITTRRTGGNVVRNVVCCPRAGIGSDEAFDVTPIALALDDYLRDHSDYQAFPRKIKIAVEGCAEDHVRVRCCDIGLRARLRGKEQGFEIYLAGGLGAVPMSGHLLEAFTPRVQLIPSIEAVLRVFNAQGNRSDRAHARMKWLVRSLGFEKFRQAVFAERYQRPSPPDWVHPSIHENAPDPAPSTNAPPASATGFERWKSFNAFRQKQIGAFAVWVRVPFGNLSPAQLRLIAESARRFSGAPPRISIEQNILFRWVTEAALPMLHGALASNGLGSCCAEQAVDVTRCVGSTCCLSAITNPLAAARALEGLFSNRLGQEPRLRTLRIRVSGCPNACSHHPAADIGLFGMSKRVHGQAVPHYGIFLGGSADGQRLGRRMLEVPACNLSAAVETLLKAYLRSGAAGQSLGSWALLAGDQRIESLLNDLVQVPSPEQGPRYYRDLEDDENFAVRAKAGECSA